MCANFYDFQSLFDRVLDFLFSFQRLFSWRLPNQTFELEPALQTFFGTTELELNFQTFVWNFRFFLSRTDESLILTKVLVLTIVSVLFLGFPSIVLRLNNDVTARPTNF